MLRVRSFRAFLPFVAALSMACATGSAVDDQPDSDTPSGSSDTGSPTSDGPAKMGDSAGDSTMTNAEGGVGDTGTDSSSKDGATGSDAADAGTETGAPDTGTKDTGAADTGTKDTGAPDTGTKDTGTDSGTCVPVTLNDGSGSPVLCPAPVSGTCGMADIAGFAPTWIPPSGLHQGLCNTTEIDAFYTDCFATGSTEAECEAEITLAPDCYNCIFSNEGFAPYGPIIDTNNEVSLINVAGCVALLEPCNLTCAEEVEAASQCESAACENNCPVTDSASLTSFENCEDTAANCDPNGCDVFATEADCESELTGAAHPASICLSGATFEDSYNNVVPVFCGP